MQSNLDIFYYYAITVMVLYCDFHRLEHATPKTSKTNLNCQIQMIIYYQVHMFNIEKRFLNS